MTSAPRRSAQLVPAVVAIIGLLVLVLAQGAQAQTLSKHIGGLDCNGYSPIQQSAHITGACTDLRGAPGADTPWSEDGHFYDNGAYIGHDEPDMTFLSSKAGSGNDVTWTETLPRDPAAAPTVRTPGSDVTHWFELSVAPWFSMALCNSQSYPELPCVPNSDENAPKCITFATCSPHSYPGAGSSFLEMQFYPPGFAPFADSISCDNSHWCASLHINDLECTLNFASCNNNCPEPTNFAFIQKDGTPTGPPAPQDMTLASNTPNSQTLLMNPGDHLRIHIFDAPVPGQPGQRALITSIDDLTTGQSGFMQASAANGFQATSISDCSGTPFNYEPEYNTAKRNNIVPWAALQTNISTQFEIGHFEACSKVTDPFTIGLAPDITDVAWQHCKGPYEAAAPPDGRDSPEATDAPCYPQGDTHGALHSAPDTVTGCGVFFSAGDVDFNGSSYWADWPVSAHPTEKFPGSFVQTKPTTGGSQYPDYFIQTDAALGETSCTPSSPAGCAVPPPQAPGKFYPYWSRVGAGEGCRIEFGNVSSGPGVNNLGQDAQYGTEQSAIYGYPEIIGPTMRNSTC